MNLVMNNTTRFYAKSNCRCRSYTTSQSDLPNEEHPTLLKTQYITTNTSPQEGVSPEIQDQSP